MPARTIIVGAGLSGLSCAFELVQRGLPVLVLEANPFPGGRTSSWNDRGMWVESGLHRFLGFYRALPDLLHRAGIRLDDVVLWEDELEIRLPDGAPRAVFRMSPAHKPFGTLASLAGNNDFLPGADKLRLARFLAAGVKDYYQRPRELDRFSVTAYAHKHGLGDEILLRLLVPLTAGLFFLPPERYSAYVLFGMLAAALRRFHRMRIGAFRGGMTEVLAQPLVESLARLGAEVRTGVRVESLLVDRQGRVSGVATSAGELSAEHIVLATSLAPAQQLIRAAFGHRPEFAPLLALPSMPAVTLQIELTRPAQPVDRPIFGPGTMLSVYSEQSRTTFAGSGGRLSAILSPPEAFLSKPPEEILAMALADAARLGMDLGKIMKDYRVIAHPADFYALSPGSEKLRPLQRTAIAGLTLAGDYTRQPMFTTMEGAVIAGREAASVVLQSDRLRS